MKRVIETWDMCNHEKVKWCNMILNKETYGLREDSDSQRTSISDTISLIGLEDKVIYKPLIDNFN